MQRRTFLKSVVATSVLSISGVAGYQYYLQSQRDYNHLICTEFLNADDQLLLSILIPVMAAGLPNPIAFDVSLNNIDQSILRLPKRTQAELRQLLDLLASSFGRLVLAGIWLDWQTAAKQDVADFLMAWRNSRLALLQQGYIGLHQVIIGSIYAESSHWPAINYAKPF